MLMIFMYSCLHTHHTVWYTYNTIRLRSSFISSSTRVWCVLYTGHPTYGSSFLKRGSRQKYPEVKEPASTQKKQHILELEQSIWYSTYTISDMFSVSLPLARLTQGGTWDRHSGEGLAWKHPHLKVHKVV